MQKVNAYFMATEADKQIAKNFKVKEFKSRTCPVVFLSDEILTVVQSIRTHLDVPINVNSGYRSAEHNNSVGGSKNSAHLIGCAADISSNKVSALQIAKAAQKLYGKTIAIGLHTRENYVHIDTVYRGNFYKETLANKVKGF